MIESIEIRNFQAHENLKVVLGPVNTVLGKTNSGKSSFLRAFRWLARNMPDGERFISWNKKFAKVTVVADGKTITRKRSKRFNGYMIDGKELKAVGKCKVPEEIERVLNVGPINFAGQHDAAFFFSDTPGQVAKNLNSIINLDVIDRTMATAASSVREARAVEQVTRSRLADARKRVKELAWVKQLDIDLKEVEASQARLDELEAKQIRLQEMLDAITDAKSKVRPVPDLSELEASAERLRSLLEEESKLDAMIRMWKTKEQEADGADTEAKEAEKELVKVMKGRCPVCGSERK